MQWPADSGFCFHGNVSKPHSGLRFDTGLSPSVLPWLSHAWLSSGTPSGILPGGEVPAASSGTRLPPFLLGTPRQGAEVLGRRAAALLAGQEGYKRRRKAGKRRSPPLAPVRAPPAVRGPLGPRGSARFPAGEGRGGEWGGGEAGGHFEDVADSAQSQAAGEEHPLHPRPSAVGTQGSLRCFTPPVSWPLGGAPRGGTALEERCAAPSSGTTKLLTPVAQPQGCPLFSKRDFYALPPFSHIVIHARCI